LTTPGSPPDRPKASATSPDAELRATMMQRPLFGPKPQPAAVPGTSVTVDGEIVRVTFENDETGFRVLRVAVEGRAQPETWVGVIPVSAPGTRVRATGRYERDARHGDQLKVETLLTVAPSTVDGIERYLGPMPGTMPDPR
jgi:exodeoxyribonuclease V alpha subunit